MFKSDSRERERERERERKVKIRNFHRSFLVPTIFQRSLNIFQYDGCRYFTESCNYDHALRATVICRLFIKPNCTVSPTVQFHKFVAVGTRREICANRRKKRSISYLFILFFRIGTTSELWMTFFPRKNFKIKSDEDDHNFDHEK